MTEKINLEKIEQDANKLLSQDGLIEMLLGAIFFVSSATYSGKSVFTPFLALYVIYLNKIMEAFRERFTYPRIGYVKLPDEDSKEVGLGILTFMGGIVLVLIFGVYLGYGRVTGERIYQWMPMVIGLILLGGLWYNYSRNGDKVNLVYIVVGLGTGLVFSLMNFSEPRQGIQYHLLLISGFFIVIGVARFISFTRKHPIIVDEEATLDE